MNIDFAPITFNYVIYSDGLFTRQLLYILGDAGLFAAVIRNFGIGWSYEWTFWCCMIVVRGTGRL